MLSVALARTRVLDTKTPNSKLATHLPHPPPCLYSFGQTRPNSPLTPPTDSPHRARCGTITSNTWQAAGRAPDARHRPRDAGRATHFYFYDCNNTPPIPTFTTTKHQNSPPTTKTSQTSLSPTPPPNPPKTPTPTKHTTRYRVVCFSSSESKISGRSLASIVSPTKAQRVGTGGGGSELGIVL
jgi:hypothetical protein